ncbi:MAG: ATP-binding cassette domain-containing protein [Culicoidibacterales bacterium]
MTKYLLEMNNITKEFPGVKALDNVNIKVKEGEIHALIGENGAGKSTLMNILCGIYPHNSYRGEIKYEGKECRFTKITESEDKKIVIIHQELALIPHLSVMENLFLGNEKSTRQIISWATTEAQAQKFMAMVGLDVDPKELIINLGVGQQQLVEIAKALAKDVRLLVLDEPTAALNDEESQKLLNLLLLLQAKGITSIMISHKLNELEQVANTLTVLRDGSSVKTIKREEGINEDAIVRAMVGRTMENRYPKRPPFQGTELALKVSDWNVYNKGKHIVKNVNFNVKKGEVIGIAGLMGAGRTELAMSIFGRAYGDKISGKIEQDNSEIKLKTVKAAIANGIAYVTENRKEYGLILEKSIEENITLSAMDKVSCNQIINHNQEYETAERYKQQLKIKCATVKQDVGKLSGGNQQKVVLSKWLFTNPSVLILDEPTRGIDVGAKYEIYQTVNSLTQKGKAVIIISSEMPELIGVCDRIYVMNEGRFVGELSGTITQEMIMSKIMESVRGGLNE